MNTIARTHDAAQVEAAGLNLVSTIVAGRFIIKRNGEYHGAAFRQKSKGGIDVRSKAAALADLLAEFKVESTEPVIADDISALSKFCAETGFEIGSDLYGKALAVSKLVGQGVRTWRMARIEPDFSVTLAPDSFVLRGGALARVMRDGEIRPTKSLGQENKLPFHPIGLYSGR